LHTSELERAVARWNSAYRARASAVVRAASHATSFSSNRPLKLDYYTPIDEAIDVDAIGSFVDGTAPTEVVAVVLFPSLRTAADVVDALLALTRDERWQLADAGWPVGQARADSTALSLTWRTKSGGLSEAMGIAPLGTMPVTRRAPYVAIVAWGGPHLNKHIRPPRWPRAFRYSSDIRCASCTKRRRADRDRTRYTGCRVNPSEKTLCIVAHEVLVRGRSFALLTRTEACTCSESQMGPHKIVPRGRT
jgi:hypothetical protein